MEVEKAVQNGCRGWEEEEETNWEGSAVLCVRAWPVLLLSDSDIIALACFTWSAGENANEENA